MQRFPIIILFIIFFSCSHKAKKQEIEVTIDDGHSCKYDLEKQLYTVFQIPGGGDTTIAFDLSQSEKQQIEDKYYTLELDKLPNEIEIYGTCYVMPPFFHTIEIKTGKRMQKLRLETGCAQFKAGTDSIFAKRINAFINFVMSFLSSKPEIKNAPASQTGYM